MAATLSPFLSHVGQPGTQEKKERGRGRESNTGIHRSAYKENSLNGCLCESYKGGRNDKGVQGLLNFFAYFKNPVMY